MFRLMKVVSAGRTPTSTMAFVTPTLSSKTLALYGKQEQTAITYEVCLSPGCLADGAQSTLDQLMSLAPPGVDVKPGVCCSLCGNGPVVMDEVNGKKYRKVVSRTAKLMDLVDPLSLNEDDNDGSDENERISSLQKAILEGYDMISEAEQAMAQNDFEQASTLYEAAISKALKPAKELQKARDDSSNGNNDDGSSNSGLSFLVKAHQSQAMAYSKSGKGEDAISAARAACDLSECTSLEALEVLQGICESHKDGESELWALRAYFDLPEPPKPTIQMATKRRSLGFRLTKLEREIG